MRKVKKIGFSSGFSKYFQKNRSYFHAKKLNFRKSFKNSYISTRDAVRNGYRAKYAETTSVFAANPALSYSILAAFFFTTGLLIGTNLTPVNTSMAGTNVSIEVDEKDSVKYDRVSLEKTEVEEKVLLSAPSSITSARVDTSKTSNLATSATNTSSSQAITTTAFQIPALGISSSLTYSSMDVSGNISVPVSTVGVYGSLYMGHTPGVFSNLAYAKAGQKIIINGRSFTITEAYVAEINTSRTGFTNGLSMSTIVNLPAGEIMLMTCTNGSSTHRTLVHAIAD